MNTAKKLIPTVTIHDNKIVTTSRDIAKTFGKEHHNVLKAIRNLECSPEFHRLNFNFVEIIDKNAIGGDVDKSHCEITRDGFTMLAFGFTGKKATQFKEAYIRAFNLMEEKLRAGAGRGLDQISDGNSDRVPNLQLVQARQAGFDRGVRFITQLRRALAVADIDETTLQNLCFFRLLGLSQREATMLCIIQLHECKVIEEILKKHGINLPAQNSTTRRIRVRETWDNLIAQAGIAISGDTPVRDNAISGDTKRIAAQSSIMSPNHPARIAEVQP